MTTPKPLTNEELMVLVSFVKLFGKAQDTEKAPAVTGASSVHANA